MKSFFSFTVLCFLAMLTSCSDTSDAESSRTENLITLLEESEYEVQQGEVFPFRIADCVDLPSCFGNNATSPYALWRLPPAPGEPTLQVNADSLQPDALGRSSQWALRQDEAVVYIGKTSPSAAYISYAPYIFSRANADNEQITVFASLTDSINQTAFDGDAFDREIAIIVTANESLQGFVRQALTNDGMNDADIQWMALSADQVRFGVDAEADRLLMLQRFALFDDPAAGEAYLADMPVDIDVMRVTPNTPIEPETVAAAARTPRATGQNENTLESSLDALEQAVRDTYDEATVTDVTVLNATTIVGVLNPVECLQNLTNCLGEVSDTVYAAGPIRRGDIVVGDPAFLGDAPGERFIAIGVNHAASGRATYSNVVVAHSVRLAGVAAFNSPDMPGTAAQYLPDDPQADKLFAVTIMRDCAGQSACIEVPTGFPGVNADEEISFQFRAYLQPGSSVSPAPGELLTERVLHIVP